MHHTWTCFLGPLSTDFNEDILFESVSFQGTAASYDAQKPLPFIFGEEVPDARHTDADDDFKDEPICKEKASIFPIAGSESSSAGNYEDIKALRS